MKRQRIEKKKCSDEKKSHLDRKPVKIKPKIKQSLACGCGPWSCGDNGSDVMP